MDKDDRDYRPIVKRPRGDEDGIQDFDGERMCLGGERHGEWVTEQPEGYRAERLVLGFRIAVPPIEKIGRCHVPVWFWVHRGSYIDDLYRMIKPALSIAVGED
jgi:hypothetical protein